ncbi:MAG: hypothetical protein ABSE16_15740 [Verrucomicrobiota bacterium]|jgi:hypothetical protein
MSDVLIYPLRLSAKERQEFDRSARAEGMTLAEWLRTAARNQARKSNKRAACLDYSDKVELDPLAESNPRQFIKRRYELHRR